LRAVEEAFRTLPERYLGAHPGFDVTYHIRLGDIGHTWEVRATTHGARVRKGVTTRDPDVTIGTDATTWMRLRLGELSGIEAFGQRKLYASGDVNLAVGFEGLFRLPNGREPLLRIHEHAVGRVKISTLTMGEGDDVLLIHGLGATKSSFFDTAAALSRHYRVHAIDLPGFGASSKPVTAPYSIPWLARTVLDLLDQLGIEHAHVAGNSMGGRIAIELGLMAPSRVGGLVLLSPAVAFVNARYRRLVSLIRPEIGFIPHKFTRGMIANQFWDLIADRDLVDPTVEDVVVHEFQSIYGSPGARYAFLRMARAIYLEEPFGSRGFYSRLATLDRPSLFVWGVSDPLIPVHLSRHVAEWLPDAEQIVLDGCGHVPQIEFPDQVNGLICRFLRDIDALGRGKPALRRPEAQAGEAA
jgi:pimeloyl-ACP methyl ester carboxylesterase